MNKLIFLIIFLILITLHLTRGDSYKDILKKEEIVSTECIIIDIDYTSGLYGHNKYDWTIDFKCNDFYFTKYNIKQRSFKEKPPIKYTEEIKWLDSMLGSKHKISYTNKTKCLVSISHLWKNPYSLCEKLDDLSYTDKKPNNVVLKTLYERNYIYKNIKKHLKKMDEKQNLKN